jgi:hypothetical protein
LWETIYHLGYHGEVGLFWSVVESLMATMGKSMLNSPKESLAAATERRGEHLAVSSAAQ